MSRDLGSAGKDFFSLRKGFFVLFFWSITKLSASCTQVSVAGLPVLFWFTVGWFGRILRLVGLVVVGFQEIELCLWCFLQFGGWCI